MLYPREGRARPELSRRACRRRLPPQLQPSHKLSPASREPRAKSLTLRLSETQYERLRRFAFEKRLSHQDIIESALIDHLDRQERRT